MHYVPFSPADGCSEKYNKNPFVINWGYVQAVKHILAFDKPLYGVVLYKGQGIPYKLEILSGQNDIQIYTIDFLLTKYYKKFWKMYLDEYYVHVK